MYITLANSERNLTIINQELKTRAQMSYNTTYEGGMLVRSKISYYMNFPPVIMAWYILEFFIRAFLKKIQASIPTDLAEGKQLITSRDISANGSIHCSSDF